MKTEFLLLTLTAGAYASALLPEQCAAPTPKSCSFYQECLEAAVPCGPNGYAIGFGFNYCQHFASRVNLFSPAGQDWMWNVMSCLQTELVPVVDGRLKLTCPQIQNFAINSHARCYLAKGHSICDLPVSDWLNVIGTIKSDALNSAVVKLALQVAGSCANGILEKLLVHPQFQQHVHAQ